MGRNDKKLGFLMHSKINSMLRFGESKHQAKAEYRAKCQAEGVKWNPAKAEGIFSIKTTEAYRQTVNEFCKWHKESGHKQYVRDLNQIPKERVMEYLQHRQEQGLSAWTISKDMSALNKVFGYGITKAEANLNQRSIDNISRSRETVSTDSRDFSKYKEAMTVAEATGIRRQSITQIRPEDFKRDANGNVTSVAVVEKGGRYREAPVLESHQKAITELVNSKPLGETMFKEYNIHIDNHSLRAEYATNLYYQIIESRGEDTNSETYRGYDKEAIKEVSEALGHSRLNVVVEHYMRDK